MKKRFAMALTFAFATTLGLTACSAAGDTDTADSAASGGASEDCIATATAAVDAARAPLELVVPTEPIDMSAVAGKKIWVINVLSNQFISESNEGYQAAADAAGIDLTIHDGQGTVNGWNEGIQQAIAQGADAIALFGIDSSIVSEAVKEAAAAGIPVVESLGTNYDSERSADIYSNVSSDYYTDGATLANWTLADSDCTASTYLIYSSAMSIWNDMRDGAVETYKELCEECTITEENVDLAKSSTEIPRLTQTKLTQAPDTGYVLATWDAALPFVESAAVQVNPDTVLLGRDGIEPVLAEIREDGMQKVTAAAPPPQWIAWTVVDDLLRAIAGQEPNGIVVPTLLIDKTNVGETYEEMMPNYNDFEAEFQKAWGK